MCTQDSVADPNAPDGACSYSVANRNWIIITYFVRRICHVVQTLRFFFRNTHLPKSYFHSIFWDQIDDLTLSAFVTSHMRSQLSRLEKFQSVRCLHELESLSQPPSSSAIQRLYAFCCDEHCTDLGWLPWRLCDGGLPVMCVSSLPFSLRLRAWAQIQVIVIILNNKYRVERLLGYLW